jgi:hypothetical protein
MATMNTEALSAFFFALGAAFCMSAVAFYWLSGYEAKRRWHPRIVFGGAALFLVFIATMFQPSGLIGAVPATCLVVFLIMKSARFCTSCGQGLMRGSVWVSLNYCSRCGARVHNSAEPG